jgi:large subunit ribosomal protein L35
MPKMKTRSSAVKRFKVKNSGKIVHNKAGMSHLLEHESAKLKRGRREANELDKANKKTVKKMLTL